MGLNFYFLAKNVFFLLIYIRDEQILDIYIKEVSSKRKKSGPDLACFGPYTN
jgi:hypothetical protein